MRFKYFFLCLIGTVLICSAPFVVTAAHSQSKPAPADAVKVVKSFYNFHFSRNKDFTKRNVKDRRAWFAPKLYRALLYEMRREAAETKAHPDLVPHFTGDPFTNSQEYPDTYRVGSSHLVRANAVVRVTFLWGEQSSRGTDTRDVAIVLKKYGSKWLICNVVDNAGINLLSELNRKEY
jgi:hypothetical protein